MAAGVFNTMRLGGEAVAVAVLGSLLTAVTQAHLADAVGSERARAVTARLLQGDMPGAVAAGGGPADGLREVASTAYTAALHSGMWGIAIVAALGAVLVGLLARDRATADVVGARRAAELAGSSAP